MSDGFFKIIRANFEIIKNAPYHFFKLYIYLCERNNYYEMNKIEFYLSDKKISEDTGISKSGISAGRRFLKIIGLIDFKLGKYRKHSTLYELKGIPQKPFPQKPFSDFTKSPFPIVHSIKEINTKEKRFNPETCKLIKETADKLNDK